MSDWFAKFLDAISGVESSVGAFLKPTGDFFTLLSDFKIGTVIITVMFLVLLFCCIVTDGKNFTVTVRKTRTITVTAMMIAANVILTLLNPLQNISPYLRVSFDCITLPVTAFMFGPITSGIAAIIQDVIAYIIKPSGAFLPQYTLCMGMKGLIFGLILYKKKPTFWRAFLAQLTVVIFVHILFNSVALAIAGGGAIVASLPVRIVKNIILLPIQAILMYVVLTVLDKRSAINRKV